MTRKPNVKPVGLTLDDPDYQRLKRFADAHHWTLATAARIIVLEHLDDDETSSGLIRGEGPETGADGP